RGLDCICLDQSQDAMLRKDLNNFMQDKDFYARMGMPYRRGYLFSGKPGTGKSSLINAISATFKRDLYYINLKDFKDDTSLQCAFSDVKKNGIIVLEDVDAQSRIVHKRSEKKDSSKYKDTTSGGLSLSALLNCMDGYTLNEGVMIIMTSNHPERLDPAVIRPGRIDLHLELGYSTHYQIQNMYSL
ncbi:P-loop containing nucleoside triphosphate hydrolase protein, partial [Globomyces pollinis-pini]